MFLFMEFVMLNMQTAMKSFDWLQFPRKIMEHVKYALHTTSMTQCILTALP